jgi:hypothetical protein
MRLWRRDRNEQQTRRRCQKHTCSIDRIGLAKCAEC